MSYELHITIPNEPTGEGIQSMKSSMPSWKVSSIDGDPDLGEGKRWYLTTHLPPGIGVKTALQHLEDAADFVRHFGMKVVRTKIEMVLYDKRFSI